MKTNTLDVIGMFEGLNPEQAKDLTNRIKQTVENFKQGANTMDQSFIESLNDDERAQLQADLEAAQAKITAKRNDTQQAGLRQQYEQELAEITQRLGRSLEPRLRAITELKAKYRAKGLPVH